MKTQRTGAAAILAALALDPSPRREKLTPRAST
jgi:hypothetical protein